MDDHANLCTGKFKMIKKGFFKSSLFLSITIHISLIYFVLTFPPTKSIFLSNGFQQKAALIDKIKEKILDEIAVVQIPKKNQENGIHELLSDELSNPYIEITPITLPDLRFDFTDQFDIDLPINTELSFDFKNLEKIEQPLADFLTPFNNIPTSELLIDQDPSINGYVPSPPVMKIETRYEPTIAQIDAYELPVYSKNLPDVLDTQIFTYTDPSQEHYFKVELTLKNGKALKEIPQEFLFVVDLTNKNAKKTYPTYKEAILKAVRNLKETDRFNVIFINKEKIQLFEEAQNYHLKTHLELEEALEKTHKFDGRLKDVIKYLGEIFDKTEENELHTHVAFFTNEPTKENTTLEALASYRHSKLSIYPIFYNEKNQKPFTLIRLVEKMGGKLLSAPTKASLPRKFSGLILEIKKTRLRNLSVQIEGDEEPIYLKLSDKTKELSLKKPLKIFGKSNGSKQLKIHLTGTHGDELYEMQKIIPLNSAKKGSCLIKQELEKTGN